MTTQPILPPLAFQPPRVYVLAEVWQQPAAAHRATRIAEACAGAQVRTITLDDLPQVVVEEGWDHPPRMGELAAVPPPIPLLGLFHFDRNEVARRAERLRGAYKGAGGFNWHLAAGGGAFVWFMSDHSELKPCPQHVCRPQWRLHFGQGCPHQCAYCSLGGVLVQHLNIEEYTERLADLLRENPWQKTFLIDDAMDVVTLEPQADALAPLMRFFKQTGDRYLILHTKSDRFEPLLEAADAASNTIMVWSLSGPTQSSRLERVAGTTATRIEAARRCEAAGFPIRYKFKPIVPVKGWREEAATMLDQALSRTRPDNLSMTVLMWMGVDALKRCIPPDQLDAEFLAAAEAAAPLLNGVQTGPFPESVRETIYRHYFAEIRRRNPTIPVTLSTESLTLWQRLGPLLGVTPANYVCGCGAGATPGCRSLATNPWRDAAAARHWDGTPALTAG